MHFKTREGKKALSFRFVYHVEYQNIVLSMSLESVDSTKNLFKFLKYFQKNKFKRATKKWENHLENAVLTAVERCLK